MAYRPRIVDGVLDEVQSVLPAIALEGAKGVGKTATATQRTRTVAHLDLPAQKSIYANNPEALLSLERPLLVDEWQLVPETWDVVRRAVDDGASGGSFVLTGSATAPASARIHSGAGRIVSVRMRPMSLYERGIVDSPVSLAALIAGEAPDVVADTTVGFDEYVHEIIQSGFPGLRELSGRALKMQLDGYLARVVSRNLEGDSSPVRSRGSLGAWLAAYGAATGTNASYEAILNAASAGEGNKPARSTVRMYRDYLDQLYLTDPLPAWTPAFAPLKRLAKGAVHHLVDPALAARLSGLSEARLKRGEGKVVGGSEGTFLGHLFESLATQSIRIYAEAADARVFFLRTQQGRHEVDLIVEGEDGAVVAIEVKLASFVEDSDVIHLRWLKGELGDRVADAVVVYAGPRAYRRSDGVLVLPLAMVGP